MAERVATARARKGAKNTTTADDIPGNASRRGERDTVERPEARTQHDTNRPLAPEDIVLIGLYRMVSTRDGDAAGDRCLDALHVELARLDAQHARRQSRPVLACSRAVRR